MRQNDANTTNVGQKNSGFSRLVLKKAGANTNPFLSHCSGRRSWMYCFIVVQRYGFSANYPKMHMENLELRELFSIFALCLITRKFQIGGLFAPRAIVRWQRLVFVIRFVCRHLQSTSDGRVFFPMPSRMASVSSIRKPRK